MNQTLIVLAALLGFSATAARGSDAGPQPPDQPPPLVATIFTDHMVLQRDRPVPVWGRATPGEEITVAFAGRTQAARADATGVWLATLAPLPASAEPRELVVEAPARNAKVTLTDVLVGDVWMCCGQSNMWFPVRESRDGDKEAAAANDPGLRLFEVEGAWSLEPAAGVKGRWQPCTPQSAAGFCAAGYYFGRDLRREAGIPIGLIQCSWPGTPAEAWTRLEALRTLPALADRVATEIATFRRQEDDNRRFVGERESWEAKHGVQPPPVADAAQGWADPALDTSDWKPVMLPATWAKFGAAAGGVFWLRKEVNLPASAAGLPFFLHTGWLDQQYDTFYFNGVEVGRAGDKPPGFNTGGRTYRVPGNLVKEGRNVIAARIAAATPHAHVGHAGASLGLPVVDRTTVSDEWLWKVEATFPPLPADALASRPKPNSVLFQRVPTALWNGMLVPLVPFAIKGAVWYQGEDNAGRAAEYRDLLTAMIGDWRARWGQGDFSFIIQQLVNYGAPAEDPNAPGLWPAMREAQAQVAAAVPACGLAVGIDIGEALDIHPKNKQDVGRRLALVALEKVYGKAIESSGPRYESMTIEGPAIRVRFAHAAGLAAKGGPLKTFAIAGADKKFVWAEARIEGDTVVVMSPQVPAPVAVRYAWAGNPAGCNLVNAAGLPAAPFRTDEWK